MKLRRTGVPGLVFIMLAGVNGLGHQAVEPDAVLVRHPNGQFVVSTVVAMPGDEVRIAGGVVVVNGRRTDIRVEPADQWGPRVLERGMYFLAGDPARTGENGYAWGLVSESRIIGTVLLGALPGRPF